MTPERALFHKLMLEIGSTAFLDREIDELLEKEDPISDVALALSTCGGDRNEQLHILNDLVSSVPSSRLDTGKTYQQIIDAFRRIYGACPEDLEKIVLDLFSIALNSGLATDRPWSDLVTLYLCYTTYQEGSISEASCRQALSRILNGGSFEDPLDL